MIEIAFPNRSLFFMIWGESEDMDTNESVCSEIFESEFSEFMVKCMIVKIDRLRKRIPNPSNTIVLYSNLLGLDFDFLFELELKNFKILFSLNFMLNNLKDS